MKKELLGKFGTLISIIEGIPPDKGEPEMVALHFLADTMMRVLLSEGGVVGIASVFHPHPDNIFPSDVGPFGGMSYHCVGDISENDIYALTGKLVSLAQEVAKEEATTEAEEDHTGHGCPQDPLKQAKDSN